MSLPTVALIGRPNVGKSTLFNKIAGERIALIDTGGIDMGSETFNREIELQALIAIEEADVVIFIVDGKEGLTSNDLKVRDYLRKSSKKVIVAINKIDNKESQNHLYDF